MEITTIQNDLNQNINIYKCNDCNGTFWSKNAYLSHWSCNKKIKCSKCNQNGHVASHCNNSNILLLDQVAIWFF